MYLLQYICVEKVPHWREFEYHMKKRKNTQIRISLQMSGKYEILQQQKKTKQKPANTQLKNKKKSEKIATAKMVKKDQLKSRVEKFIRIHAYIFKQTTKIESAASVNENDCKLQSITMTWKLSSSCVSYMQISYIYCYYFWYTNFCITDCHCSCRFKNYFSTFFTF